MKIDRFEKLVDFKMNRLKNGPILMDRLQSRKISKWADLKNGPISKWTNFKMDRFQNGPTSKLIETWSPTRTPSSKWTILKIDRFQNERILDRFLTLKKHFILYYILILYFEFTSNEVVYIKIQAPRTAIY